MWGRKRPRYYKRRTNIVFVIFRLFLSLIIFAVLLGGIYSAYKQFSGVDLVKADPKLAFKNYLSSEKFFGLVQAALSFNFKPNFIQKQPVIPADKPKGGQTAGAQTQKPKAKLDFKFVLVADSHNDNVDLKKALNESRSKNPLEDPKFVIGLGDYTDVGTVDELTKTKKEFDESGLRYFLTAGDHDLWDSRNRQVAPYTDFSAVFGSPYQTFEFSGVRFLILANADNYGGVDQTQMKWLSDQLNIVKKEDDRLVLAFLHEPLYHPSSDHYMGRVSPDLKKQAADLVKILKEAKVKEVFAGDIHYFTQYIEPVNSLHMTTIGAVTDQRNAQLPRYSVVSVYGDGSYSVEDVEIR